MKNRGGHCALGFLICVESFAETVEKEMRQSVEAKDRSAVLWWLVRRALLGHSVTLSVLGYDFDCVVYFAESQSYNRDVLGRQGWIDRIRVGLVDYDGKLYLSDYNDPLS